ncbi:hypothetical protein AB0M39_28330 [Streptomyces sp. NPDC051907]|uniref:hypothetical protein n=1 Tax=Streptomyces sp. NPDC051907 TaxID=3155284 RepID=UPI0034348E1C
MPLAETEWDLVTGWAREYLLDTPEPYSRLDQAGFPPDFVRGLRLTPLSAQNARVLVDSCRKSVDGQERLLAALAASHELREAPPEAAKADEFLGRLREDIRASASKDVFRSSVVGDGSEVFLGRERLRRTLRRMVADPQMSVLAVDGDPGSGRSYTYHLVHHVGLHVGFQSPLVTLSATATAESLIRQLAEFVADPSTDGSPSGPPRLSDLPPRLDDALRWVVSRATASDERFWFVLDECDRVGLGSDVWDCIGRLALAVHGHAVVRPEEAPRLVLLGYGPQLPQLPFELRGHVCWDTASLPGPDDLRAFFEQYFHESPPPSAAEVTRPDARTAELVEVAVQEVLLAAERDTADGRSYMEKIGTAAEGAIRVIQSL